MPDSDTGFAVLPDIGTLGYNGVVFSQLYRSRVSGTAVKDNAQRTVKWVEWKITVEGVVTLSPGDKTTDAAWITLRRQLDQQAGALFYSGKGFGPLEVNVPGGTYDLNWGPKPQTLDFQPLGSSRSALITWTVTTCIPEVTPIFGIQTKAAGPLATISVVQFNFEDTIRYGEDGYSFVSRKGTLEIPMTRPSVITRTITQTVDDFRSTFLDKWLIDLIRYRVTDRTINISRDKRVMEWSLAAEELPYMGPPAFCPMARGSFTVRPVSPGPGLAQWFCTLRGTYTVRKDYPRRTAWWAFLSLLHERFWWAKVGTGPKPGGGGDLTGVDFSVFETIKRIAGLPATEVESPPAAVAAGVFGAAFAAEVALEAKPTTARAVIWGFGIDEGIYLDSKTITFEATWRLITTWHGVITASGTWRQSGIEGGNMWAMSMRDISGSTSWLVNNLLPSDDVIVDMGSVT